MERAADTPCKVKVCGIRNQTDLHALVQMDVEFVGFNFHPASPRYIPPDEARLLVQKCQGTIPVGIFVDADLGNLQNILRLTGIEMAQLHGSESWEYVERVPVPVIKAWPSSRLSEIAALRPEHLPANLAYWLLDAQSAAGFGGTGISFDWELLRDFSGEIPYFLAGGLGPHNLSEALRACQPYAVDLNSKVESEPGRKDPEKIRRCLDIVRNLTPSI